MNSENKTTFMSIGFSRVFLAALMILSVAGVSTASVTIEQSLLLPSPDGVQSRGDGLANTETAESFFVSTGFEVENISWWGVYDPEPVSDNFVVRVFRDDGAGLPDNTGTVFEASNVIPTRTTTDQPDIAGGEVFAYSFDIPTADVFALLPGDYWLSVVNLSLGLGSDWFWSEGLDADDTNAFRDTSVGADWTLDQTSIDLAFSISGTDVPSGEVAVPPVWLLVALPAALLVLRRR